MFKGVDNALRVGGIFSSRCLTVTDTAIKYTEGNEHWEVERLLVTGVMARNAGELIRLELTQANGDVLAGLLVSSRHAQKVRDWLQSHLCQPKP